MAKKLIITGNIAFYENNGETEVCFEQASKPVKSKRKKRYPADFELFYKLYPKKGDKAECYDLWKPIPDETKYKIYSVLEKETKPDGILYPFGENGCQYIPAATRWLNEKRYLFYINKLFSNSEPEGTIEADEDEIDLSCIKL